MGLIQQSKKEARSHCSAGSNVGYYKLAQDIAASAKFSLLSIINNYRRKSLEQTQTTNLGKKTANTKQLLHVGLFRGWKELKK